MPEVWCNGMALPSAEDVVKAISDATPHYIQVYLKQEHGKHRNIKIVNQQIRREAIVEFNYSDMEVLGKLVRALRPLFNMKGE